jgi:hypothetical protein
MSLRYPPPPPPANGLLLTDPPAKAKAIIHKNGKAPKAVSVSTGSIPKPMGHHSHNFNIFTEMQAEGEVDISKKTYADLIVSRLSWFELYP